MGKLERYWNLSRLNPLHRLFAVDPNQVNVYEFVDELKGLANFFGKYNIKLAPGVYGGERRILVDRYENGKIDLSLDNLVAYAR